MTRRTLMAAGLGLLMLVCAAEGQENAKPDFSGRWRMDKEKSQFAGFKTPDMITRTVDQRGVIMNVHTVETLGGKTVISDLSYNIDGTPTQNIMNGRNAECKTYWDDKVLVVRTSMKTSGGDDELIEDRWALSDDKKTVTVVSHIETDKGEADMTLVCDRENPK